MALIPSAYSIIPILPVTNEERNIISCDVNTTKQQQLIVTIYEQKEQQKEQKEQKEQKSGKESKKDHKKDKDKDKEQKSGYEYKLNINFHSNKYSCNQTINLKDISEPSKSYCAIDQHGQDVIVLFVDYYYFTYTISKDEDLVPTLRAIKIPKGNKLSNVTCFSLINSGKNGLYYGVFGTSSGAIGIFNINTSALVKTIQITKSPILSIKFCVNCLFIQVENAIYTLKIFNGDELTQESPNELMSQNCQLMYSSRNEIGINVNNILHIYGSDAIPQTEINPKRTYSNELITCKNNNLNFIFDKEYLIVTYKDINNVIYNEKIVSNPTSFFTYQLPHMDGLSLMEGLIFTDKTNVYNCKSRDSLERLITNQLINTTDETKHKKLIDLICGIGCSKANILEIAKVVVKTNPMTTHLLLLTANIFSLPIYTKILTLHRLTKDQYDSLIKSFDTLADQNSSVADFLITVYVQKICQYYLKKDASFICYLDKKVLYDRVKALQLILQQPSLFKEYILRLLLLGELKVIEKYCSFTRSLTMNVIQPDLFIPTLIKNEQKSIFELLNTPPIYSTLTNQMKFELLFKAIKLSPSITHIAQLESLLPYLNFEQLESLTQLIKPKTITFNTISIDNNNAKYCLYDLYVKATITLKKPTFKTQNDFINLIQTLNDPLFNFSTIYIFLITEEYFIEAAQLLCFYKQFESALELLLDVMEGATNEEEIEHFIVYEIINKMNEDSFIQMIQNDTLNDKLMIYIYERKNFREGLKTMFVTTIHFNYFRRKEQLRATTIKENKEYLEKILPYVEGSSQRLNTTTKNSSELIIFCPKKHKYTIHSLKQKAKTTTKLSPNDSLVIQMNGLIEEFLKDDKKEHPHKLICPICVKSILSDSKEDVKEK